MDEKVKLTKMGRLELREGVLRERMRKLQAQLKAVETEKKTLKGLEITRMIKALKLPREELYSFLKSGALPKQVEASKIVESEGFENEVQ